MSKVLKVILLASLLGNVLFIGGFGFFVSQKGGLGFITDRVSAAPQKYDENIHYIERNGIFEKTVLLEGSIVFLGDSLTGRAPWNELLGNSNVVNRGIGSDTTEGMLNRLDSILASNPSKIFIMGGINDFPHKDIEEISNNIEQMVVKINETNPDTEVYIQSVLPVNMKMYGRGIDNQKVKELNERLVEITTKYNLVFIDVFSEVVEGDQLISHLTLDGIHLTGDGYEIWRNTISGFLD